MMTSEEFERTLRHLLRQRPFQPFQIELDDGTCWVVGQPQALWYVEGASAVYFQLDGTFDFVNCEVVKHLMPLVPAATA